MQLKTSFYSRDVSEFDAVSIALQTAPAFSWDETRERYLGPAQREEMEAELASRDQEEKQAQVSGSWSLILTRQRVNNYVTFCATGYCVMILCQQ